MNLKEYLRKKTKEELMVFARRVGTTTGNITQLIYGYRKPSFDMAVAIWKASEGSITLKELRPDKEWDSLVRKNIADAIHPSSTSQPPSPSNFNNQDGQGR